MLNSIIDQLLEGFPWLFFCIIVVFTCVYIIGHQRWRKKIINCTHIDFCASFRIICSNVSNYQELEWRILSGTLQRELITMWQSTFKYFESSVIEHQFWVKLLMISGRIKSANLVLARNQWKSESLNGLRFKLCFSGNLSNSACFPRNKTAIIENVAPNLRASILKEMLYHEHA